jgi:hypothetical protein
MAAGKSTDARYAACTDTERTAVKDALFVLCGSAARVRIQDTMCASVRCACKNGSVNMLHFNVAFVVETEPYVANTANVVDFSVMYNATYCVLDRDRSGVCVDQSYLRVIETLSERYPRLLAAGSIELYMAYMTFVVSVMCALGIPEYITDRLTITAVNGVAQ